MSASRRNSSASDAPCTKRQATIADVSQGIDMQQVQAFIAASVSTLEARFDASIKELVSSLLRRSCAIFLCVVVATPVGWTSTQILHGHTTSSSVFGLVGRVAFMTVPFQTLCSSFFHINWVSHLWFLQTFIALIAHVRRHARSSRASSVDPAFASSSSDAYTRSTSTSCARVGLHYQGYPRYFACDSFLFGANF